MVFIHRLIKKIEFLLRLSAWLPFEKEIFAKKSRKTSNSWFITTYFWLNVGAKEVSTFLDLLFITLDFVFDFLIQGVFRIKNITVQIFPNPNLFLKYFSEFCSMLILAIFRKQPVIWKCFAGEPYHGAIWISLGGFHHILLYGPLVARHSIEEISRISSVVKCFIHQIFFISDVNTSSETTIVFYLCFR